LGDHDRVVGVERAQLRVRADEAGGGDARVLRLVDPLVRAQPRMRLERVDDLREQLLLRRAGRGRQVRQVAEPEPGEEAVGRGRVLELLLGRELRVDLLGVPVRPPVRTKLTPPFFSSCQASLPSGVFPPTGGGSDTPSGKTFRSPTTRTPVGSTVTRATASRVRLAR
jgi:hypothetical protein